MIIPSALQFTAERLMKSAGRTGTADNDINAVVSVEWCHKVTWLTTSYQMMMRSLSKRRT